MQGSNTFYAKEINLIHFFLKVINDFPGFSSVQKKKKESYKVLVYRSFDSEFSLHIYCKFYNAI